MWSAKTNKNEFSRSTFVFPSSRYLKDYMKKLLSIVQHQMREPFGRVSFIRASTSVPTLILSFTNPNPKSTERFFVGIELTCFIRTEPLSVLKFFNPFSPKFVCISSLSSFLLTLSSARVYQWQMALDLGICCQLLYCCGGWIHKWSNVLISSSDQQLNEYYARLSMQTPFLCHFRIVLFVQNSVQ